MVNKTLNKTLKICEINDSMKETTKDGKKEMMAVTLADNLSPNKRTLTVRIKGAKSTHPLKGWGIEMCGTDAELSLELPSKNQKKITEFGKKKNE